MTDPVPAPLGIHDPGCSCLRCLESAYRDARATVTETAKRYQATRVADEPARVIAAVRQAWTEARQVLLLAEHALRSAEDGARIEARKDQAVDSLRWQPGSALPDEAPR